MYVIFFVPWSILDHFNVKNIYFRRRKSYMFKIGMRHTTRINNVKDRKEGVCFRFSHNQEKFVVY